MPPDKRPYKVYIVEFIAYPFGMGSQQRGVVGIFAAQTPRAARMAVAKSFLGNHYRTIMPQLTAREIDINATPR